jgi:hypothetical protein
MHGVHNDRGRSAVTAVILLPFDGRWASSPVSPSHGRVALSAVLVSASHGRSRAATRGLRSASADSLRHPRRPSLPPLPPLTPSPLQLGSQASRLLVGAAGAHGDGALPAPPGAVAAVRALPRILQRPAVVSRLMAPCAAAHGRIAASAALARARARPAVFHAGAGLRGAKKPGAERCWSRAAAGTPAAGLRKRNKYPALLSPDPHAGQRRTSDPYGDADASHAASSTAAHTPGRRCRRGATDC